MFKSFPRDRKKRDCHGKKDKLVIVVSMSQLERAEIWDDPLIKEEKGRFIFIFKPDVFYFGNHRRSPAYDYHFFFGLT